jgi:predicted MPP superfamily phosphohydrolase
VERLDNEYNFDRIIFVGDYVDDWHTNNHDSIQTLEKVIKLKTDSWNKYTFLWGNHDISYVGYPCGGHCFDELEHIVSLKLKNYFEYFDLYTEVKCGDKTFIVTHAGISNPYLEMILGKDTWRKTLDDMNTNKLTELEKLKYCARYRGGNDAFSSFIWCDRKEHLMLNEFEKPIISYQIIGHSTVKNIDINNDYIFIDTHSTYSNGNLYGDKSYLIWDDDKFEVVY